MTTKIGVIAIQGAVGGACRGIEEDVSRTRRER